MEGENLRFLLSLIYILPSYVLHCCLFYTIFFSVACHKYSGSFYTIFGFSTVYYIIDSIFYYLDMRFAKVPFLIPFVKTWGIRGFMVTFIHLISWYSLYAIHLSNCLLAFNRLTVFALKAGYRDFWDRYLKILLAIPIFLPVIFVWHIPFTEIYVQLEDETDPDGTRFLTEGNSDAVPWMNNPRNSAILISITSFLSLGMDIYVIAKLIQQKWCLSKTKNTQQKKVSSKDIQLSIYAFLIFGTEVVYCIFMFFFMTASKFDTILWLLDIQVYLTDITTLAPAWFVLITNKSLRQQIAYYFGITKSVHHDNSVFVADTVISTFRQQQSTQIRIAA